MKLRTILLLIFSTGLVLQAGAQQVTENNILAMVDNRLNFQSDFSCNFTMVTYRVGKQPESQQMMLFSRPKEIDGEEKFLALVVKPDVDKGTGYLGIGDNYWIYDPESRKFSHSSARENVQDSDVNNDDLGSSDYLEDYRVLSMSEGMLGKIPCYILDIEGTNEAVDYKNIKLWVGKDELLPYKEEDYSISGRLMRTVLAPKWSKIGDRYIYRQVYFVDELKAGNKTILLFDQISLNSIPDRVFTKSYLERSNR